MELSRDLKNIKNTITTIELKIDLLLKLFIGDILEKSNDRSEKIKILE